MRVRWSNQITCTPSFQPPVSFCQSGTRNVEESRNTLENSAAAHHRKLAAEKYTFAGYGISTENYWSSGDDCGYGNNFYLYVSDGVTKYQSNGKPSKTTSTYGWGGLDVWTDCSETTATRTYAYIDIYGTEDSTLTVAKKLNTASYNLETEVFAVTEICNKTCYIDEFGEYCYYGECNTIADGYVPATISVSLTATGLASTYSSKSTYKGPGYSARYSSKGKERPASAVLSITLDGEAIDVPVDADSYAYIQQSTGGSFYKY